MSASLSPAGALPGADEAPIPIRARMICRLPAAVFGLWLVAQAVVHIQDRTALLASLGRSVEPAYVLTMLATALPAFWFFAAAFLPVAYLYRDRIVASRLMLGATTRFDGPARIEDGALVANGRKRIRRFGVAPDVWRAIEQRFGG